MVKVINIVCAQSTSHIDAGASIAEMESETNSISTPIVTSFDASITGTAFEFQIGRGIARSMHDAIYSARLALFIHGITSAKRTHQARPAVLIGESSTRL